MLLHGFFSKFKSSEIHLGDTISILKMPERTTTTKRRLEPIPLYLFQCPVCDGEIKGTLKQAYEHVNTPLDKPFPLGFVFVNEDKKRDFAPSGGISVLVEYSRITFSHTHAYMAATGIHDFGIEEIQYSGYGIASRELRDGLAQGNLKLLTVEEIEEFRRYNPNLDDFLRKKGGTGLVTSLPD